MPAIITVLLISLCLLPATALAGSATLGDATVPKEGQTLTSFTLPVPENPEQAAYLGIDPEADTFSLNDIEAKVLLVEIFSMYCPFCQREAPEVNAMYDKLRDSQMADTVKMLGIGTGNSAYEVNVFREKFQVTMPLFPDQDYTIYNTIGQVGTPFFMLLQMQPGKDELRILEVHEGILNDPEAFYSEMLNRAKQLGSSD